MNRITLHTVKPQDKGFTLIELLVVISIISLLISILLPALGAARKSARAITCGAQVKQMGVAVVIYCNDNKDFFPFAYITTGKIPWYAALTNNSKIEGGTNPEYKLFHCPEDTNYTKPGDSDYNEVIRSNYTYNMKLGRSDWYGQWLAGGDSWKADYAPNKQGGVLKPTKALVLLDGAGKYTYPTYTTDPTFTFSFSTSWVGTPARLLPTAYTVDYRHQDSLNALFVDGHVERISGKYWPFEKYTCEWAVSDNYSQ